MLEEGMIDVEPRTYIGMSSIGHECMRYLWFNFRWAFSSRITKRQARLFSRGHREEEVIIQELEKIGIKCHSFQEEFVLGWGHIKGHCDGMCDNVPEAPKTTHLLEIKTMNDAAFKDIWKRGLEVSKPIYYAQCIIGMYGYGLSRALFISTNKNDDAYYVTRVREDKRRAKDLIRRAESIILSEEPPAKIFKPTWYACKYCDANAICHYGGALNFNCRTCINSSPGKEGKWYCKETTEIDTKKQKEGCSDYSPIVFV
jgi:hypothetical protein